MSDQTIIGQPTNEKEKKIKYIRKKNLDYDDADMQVLCCHQNRKNEFHTAAMAKTAGMTMCPSRFNVEVPSLTGEAARGGGGFSTRTATFMPLKQKPFPLRK